MTVTMVLAVLASLLAANPAGAQEAPGIPTGVRAIEVDGATVVTWNRPTGRPTTYRVQLRTVAPTPRIVGGAPASATDAPYQAAVWVQTSVGLSFCGGTMITDQTVVTAAHCVGDARRAADIEVATGELRLSRIAASDRVTVASFEIHPDYVHERRDYHNDVAVLRLSRPIPEAVTIPIDTDPGTPVAGTPARISGWGVTDESQSSAIDRLRIAEIEVRADPGAPCPRYGSVFRGDIMLCADAPGGGGGIDACRGDSGGPLVVEEGGRMILAGITSWGEGCARAGYPGVYTRVSRFADWILEQLHGGGWTTRTVRCLAQRCLLRIPGVDTQRRTEFRVAAVRGGRVSAFSPTVTLDTVRPRHCDHDADGRADLVVGIPAATVRGRAAAGALVAFDAAAPPAVAFDQRRSALRETPGIGDGFASALVCGDFDGDGFGDLAIGVPGETVDGARDAGVVHVLYGRADGLAPARAQVWRQGAGGLGDRPGEGDRFGSALAVGDLDGDGLDDLIIGAPGDMVGGRAGAGAVHVLYGTPRRLRSVGSEIWTRTGRQMTTSARADDGFGSALAVGDFDGDGHDDVAVGVPGERIGGREDAGLVQVLAGGLEGLTAAGVWHQAARGGLDGRRQAGAAVGSVLAAGDLTGDGIDDLAIGAPTARVGRTQAAGEVHLLAGSPTGLDASTAKRLNQTLAGEGPGVGNGFGRALAIGDLDGAGAAELVVGVPGVGRGAGAFVVLEGVLASPTTVVWWSPSNRGVRVPAVAGSSFGAALALLDLDGDGRDDLAVGAPGAAFGGRAQAGRVQIMVGTSSGGFVTPAGLSHRGGRGVPGRPSAGDRFGSTIAS